MSTKSHLVELAQELVAPERATQFAEKQQKYAQQKDELMAKAREFDAEAARANDEAAALERPHTHFAMAMIFLQIAISIASITALTRRRWLFSVALLSGAVGVALCVSAWVGS